MRSTIKISAWTLPFSFTTKKFRGFGNFEFGNVALKVEDTRDKLSVDGYIRKCMKALDIIIPVELLDLILVFYHIKCVVIEWSSVYKSEIIGLSADNKCVKSPTSDWYHAWIIGKDPVFEGIHCWRLFVNNPRKGWMAFCVSKPNFMYSVHYGQNNVIGIAYNDCWYYSADFRDIKVSARPTTSGWKMGHFNKERKMMIDVLLDCDKGQLEFCVVTKDDNDYYRPKFSNLATNTNINEKNGEEPYNGYVPHLNIHNSAINAEIRAVKMNPKLYGKYQTDLTFDDVESETVA